MRHVGGENDHRPALPFHWNRSLDEQLEVATGVGAVIGQLQSYRELTANRAWRDVLMPVEMAVYVIGRKLDTLEGNEVEAKVLCVHMRY